MIEKMGGWWIVMSVDGEEGDVRVWMEVVEVARWKIMVDGRISVWIDGMLFLLTRRRDEWCAVKPVECWCYGSSRGFCGRSRRL